MTEGRKLDTRIERELTDAEMRLHRLLEARQQAGPEEREVLSRVIEELGWYDPNTKDNDKQLSLQRERIEYWLGVGAQPSDTVRNMLIKNGIAVKKR